MSRERLAARSAADQQMELARALNYDNLVLDDSTALTHATDTSDPDYWVDETNQTFDPDGSGPIGAEGIVRVPGQSPAFHHIQTPIVQGNTTFAIYVYVTWVDSPSDGTVAAGSDQADGNANGADDSNGHDQKRVTVAVTWRDPVRGITMNTTQSSLFSDGQIPYHQPAHNSPPTVSCPQVAAVNNLQWTFTPIATDSDGTITTVIWAFSDSTGNVISTQATAFTNLTYTFPSGGTYGIVNTAVDNGSASSNNIALSCSVTVVDPADGNGGPDGGSNAIKILSDVAYTNLLNVTLTLNYPNGANGATQMQFSNDGVTWSAKQAVSPSTIWTLVGGDGLKTVWVRYWDANGLYGKIRSDNDHARSDEAEHAHEPHGLGSVVQRREPHRDAYLGGLDRLRDRARRLPPLAAAHDVEHLDPGELLVGDVVHDHGEEVRQLRLLRRGVRPCGEHKCGEQPVHDLAARRDSPSSRCS